MKKKVLLLVLQKIKILSLFLHDRDVTERNKNNEITLNHYF